MPPPFPFFLLYCISRQLTASTRLQSSPLNSDKKISTYLMTSRHIIQSTWPPKIAVHELQKTTAVARERLQIPKTTIANNPRATTLEILNDVGAPQECVSTIRSATGKYNVKNASSLEKNTAGRQQSASMRRYLLRQSW